VPSGTRPSPKHFGTGSTTDPGTPACAETDHPPAVPGPNSRSLPSGRSLAARARCATIAFVTTPWQTHWHKHPGVRSGDQLSLGERSADRMRNIMGSWPFVFSFFAVMIAWALVNTLLFEHILHHKAFDPYPYILLNLFLSMLAGVQAAALLIAAKRADSISSEIAIHTENNTDDIKTLVAENTTLTTQVKTNTDLLEEIHLHVTNIAKQVGAEMGRFPPRRDAAPTELSGLGNRPEPAPGFGLGCPTSRPAHRDGGPGTPRRRRRSGAGSPAWRSRGPRRGAACIRARPRPPSAPRRSARTRPA